MFIAATTDTLSNATGAAIIFGGDTAFTDAFARLRDDRPYDLAIMSIGAYDPWIRVHANPEQVIAMCDAAGVRYLMPVHHQTFRLSVEPFREPIERLETALQKEPERIALRKSETFDRFAKWLDAQTKRLVMHRHEIPNAGRITHRDHLLGIGMHSDPRIIRADAHDRQIIWTVITQSRKRIGKCRVAAENEAAPVAFDNVSVVAAINIAQHSRSQ